MKSVLRKRKKKPVVGLNITSLMDVLTIILIFLLVNYSDIEDVQDIPDFISMPTLYSQPDQKLNEDVKVNIGSGQIAILNKQITYRNFEVEKERVMEEMTQILGDLQTNRKDKGIKTRLSIRADENVPYQVIDEVLVGAGAVGITQIDLLAMAKGE